MAFESNLETRTYAAAEDLSGHQFCPVALDASGNVAIPAQGVWCIGILQNKPSAVGEAATVAVRGQSKALVAGAIDVSAAGRLVTAAATSEGVETTNGKTGDYIVGYLLGDDTVDNELREVEINPIPHFVTV
jgi:regulator of RNase E activity RraA